MSPLPSGIVAFLMTDVEGSARAWNSSAVEADAAVAALDMDVRSIVAAHDGSVVKARGEGDSHFGVFSEASSALVAAASLQRRSDTRLSIRAAVLIGEAFPREGDYLGPVVNHGARIRSVAHGGQTVTTRSVVDVASGRLPDDLTFRTLGTHRVRDIESPIELFQLCGLGLRASFPPLHTSAFTASVMMAVVSVDAVRSTRRLAHPDEELIAWQRGLIRWLRDLSDDHDGRHLKLVGDGCLVAFEDPRAALAFADCVHERGAFRVGIALGLVEDVEGELTGRTVFEAVLLARAAGAGDVSCCKVMQSVCHHVG